MIKMKTLSILKRSINMCYFSYIGIWLIKYQMNTEITSKHNVKMARTRLNKMHVHTIGKIIDRNKTHEVTPQLVKRYSSLAKQLQAKIKATGPITVAEYMNEVLTNPSAGYYMTKDMICEEGDFITSPEISQMFGELVGVWFFSEWQKLGAPRPMQFIELGPGRGSLAEDVLRVFAKFNAGESITVSFVEVSPHLSKLQANRLCATSKEQEPTDKIRYFRHGKTSSGTSIFWYKNLEDVPELFSCIMAHEFFDALPIHKFQRMPEGWREILVDTTDSENNIFRFVLSPRETVGSKFFIKKDEKRNHIEISPKSGVIMQQLAKRLSEDGGMALIVDYGHDGSKSDTFRAFKNHKLHDPLVEPGTADLTADVDFAYLRDVVSDTVLTFGPVTQAEFLKRMGIDVRLQVLLKSCTPEQHEKLVAGYHMVVDEDKMGKKFKVLSIFPAVLKEFLHTYPVSGFYDSYNTEQ